MSWSDTLPMLLPILALIALYFGLRRSRSRKPEKPTTRFVCTRCENHYSLPDVPSRCRVCGGNVEPMAILPEQKQPTKR